ncbi:MAG: aminotransferase class V-fold PLP-dependent enzyme [bacterium]|jgi:selenocysteine lyase/cysteine desulfurase|nr:aminotransferase class V-fold PLP-dependent enzyme [candidate division KSB1 bacterium]MDH7559497.1 aminotransferase class V-fold PLP-dependent enzyme [bacterium]
MIVLTDMDTRRSFLRKLAAGGLAASLAFPLRKALSSWSLDASALSRPDGGSPEDEDYWRLVREHFPLTTERTYFNNGGLGPSPRIVLETYREACLRLEKICETGHEEVGAVRAKAASFLGCEPTEIAFTRNTTEGMNIIAWGLPLRKGDEVVTSTHEHPGGAIPWLAVAKEKGVVVRLFEPAKTKDENLRIIERSVTRKTRVLSLSHITCTTGLLFPVKEVSALCRQRGIWLVLDGAHPPGMIPVDLHGCGCDFYATSGHKWLLGPKGTGLLYIRKEMSDVWRPTYVGAYSDAKYDLDTLTLEYRREAEVTEYGTRNTPLILALGAAFDFLGAIGMPRVAARGRFLAELLKKELAATPTVEILTPMEQDSAASIVTFRPTEMKTSALLDALNREGFRVRSVGEHRLDAVRVSVHVYTSVAEVEHFCHTVRRITSGA